jgi:hypothetical protein
MVATSGSSGRRMMHGRIGSRHWWVARTGIMIGNRRVVAAKRPEHRMSRLIFVYDVRRNLLSMGCDTMLTNGR